MLPSTHRRLLTISVAAGALAAAIPVHAQTADGYEYAQPPGEGTIIYRSREVVQGVPAPRTAPGDAPHAALPPEPPLPPVPPIPPMASRHLAPPPAAYPAVPPPYVPGGGYAPGAYPAYSYPAAPAFDRGRWLADCRDRIRGVDRTERGAVIGGLLGALAGGVIGNRAWDSERTAGTLLGAGVGGLAGLAVGSAIGAASERGHRDDCAFYLDRYMLDRYGAGPQGHAGYGYPGYGYGGYMLVPVLVAVPQRQVIRETVTEEWIDAPVRSRSLPARRHRAAPARTKYIKGN